MKLRVALPSVLIDKLSTTFLVTKEVTRSIEIYYNGHTIFFDESDNTYSDIGVEVRMEINDYLFAQICKAFGVSQNAINDLSEYELYGCDTKIVFYTKDHKSRNERSYRRKEV
jgi:hypothetical protein